MTNYPTREPLTKDFFVSEAKLLCFLNYYALYILYNNNFLYILYSSGIKCWAHSMSKARNPFSTTDTNKTWKHVILHPTNSYLLYVCNVSFFPRNSYKNEYYVCQMMISWIINLISQSRKPRTCLV